MEDTPRLRSRAPRPPHHQLLFKPPSPRFPPPPPPPTTISATTSPSHDDFSFPSTVSSSFGGGGDDLQLPLSSMSRTPVVGRVGSDLSHLNHSRSRASLHHHDHHHATTTSSKDRDSSRDTRPAKSKALPPFFSGLGISAWRKDSSSSNSREDDVKQGEEKRKLDRAKRTLDVGRQWVKRHMASMVEQLRASFSASSRHYSSSEKEQRRRRPHSFSGHGPPGAAAREREMRERERWRRRRRDQLSSAPASLRVSPANSGHLSVGGLSVTKVSTSSEESTMEELQSAIEAAIAHCKNSISVVAKQTQTQTQTTAAGDDDGDELQ